MIKHYISAESTQNIELWGHARNIINGGTLSGQVLKLSSELSELALAVAEDNRDSMLDGLGDCAVLCVIIAAQLKIKDINELANFDMEAMLLPSTTLGPYIFIGQVCDAVAKGDKRVASLRLASFLVSLEAYAKALGLSLQDGVNRAWAEIKDRKGVMYNGVFIKSDDCRYELALHELGLEAVQ